MARVSDIQQKILEYLRQCAQEGIPPTIREICTATGLKSTSSVHNHLKKLEDEGLITRGNGLNRAIRLANDTPVVQVPLLGRVTAGLPAYAYEEVVASIPYPADRHGADTLFALRVQGDSMIEAGILDGDVIIAEKTTYAENGEIVIGLIEDEATVKRFYREKDGYIRLQPENPLYDPIISRDIQVIGKVVACFRYYS